LLAKELTTDDKKRIITIVPTLLLLYDLIFVVVSVTLQDTYVPMYPFYPLIFSFLCLGPLSPKSRILSFSFFRLLSCLCMNIILTNKVLIFILVIFIYLLILGFSTGLRYLIQR